MKKLLCSMLAISCCLVGNYAAADDEIKLPMHNLKDNVSLKTALEKRKTSRVFNRENLSTLDISNLLWAGYGINRTNGKRTVPVARGIYAVEMYVALPDGVYYHNLLDNSLKKITDKDMRADSDSRKMGAKAPVVLVMVADSDAFDGKGERYIAMEAGAIMQNLYLYCAAYDLNTVVCASFNKDVWAKELKLPKNKYVILTQIVGCPLKKGK